MALEDWKEINENEYLNKKKTVVIYINEGYTQFVVNVMNAKTFHTLKQKRSNTRKSALIYAKNYMKKHS